MRQARACPWIMGRGLVARSGWTRRRQCLIRVVAFVVAGGDGAELPELAEAALHGVALLVAPGIEGRRTAARAAAVAAVLVLVLLDRDDRMDPALAQVGAVRRRRVRPIGHHPARPGAGPTLAAAGNADLVQQRDELRAVAILARGQDAGDRAAPAVGGQVDLGAQPATGPAQRLPDRPGREILVIRWPPLASSAGSSCRAPAACWCARITVESALRVQSFPSASSHPARSRPRIFCQVPSSDQQRCRL